MTRSISQPTDSYLESLTVAQLKAVYNAHRGTSNQIDSVLLMNRITCRLFDLIGEEATEKFVG